MPNTFFGLTIGKTGLYTYQAALNTTAHNASNVDTEGYSKQVTNRTAAQAISLVGAYGMQGSGVDVNSITQLRNVFYDEKFWENSQVLGNYNAKSYYVKAIENYYSEVNSEGTTKSFDDAFNALNGLQSTPGDTTYRTQVTEGFKSFTDYIQSLYEGMQSIQEEANDEIKNAASRINSIAEQIATLNKQINTIEIQGMHANDLRDARALLIDELSEYGKLKVTEENVGDGVGVTQYVVRLDGKTVVDTYTYNTLTASAKQTNINQCDIDGLYELTWSDGQVFNSTSPTLGGKLQALFEVRDGNNKENFIGTANGTKGQKELVLTDTGVDSINKLNIAEADGVISIGANEYEYSSFEVTVEADGSYTYTFQLKRELQKDVTDMDAKIGNSVDYKGIPYYMSRLSEFVRTFSASFNNVHKKGEDQNADKGRDFFTGLADSENVNYSFETEENGFSSLLAVDADGNLVKVDGYAQASYYHMTAGNFTVNMDIMDDPRLMACSSDYLGKGISEGDIAKELTKLKEDVTMFKQGTPGSFLQTFTGEIGIDGQEAENFAKNQSNILEAVNLQRMSISGVDSDEEGMDLMKFQNAYELSSKVISVMNEIYAKLINETGV